MKKGYTIILIAVLLVGGSWGFLVHRTVNQLAIYALPKPLQAFFYINKDSISLNAPRPDQRRNMDPTEGNKHFMDMEYYGNDPFTAVPHSWEDAVAKFSEDTLRKYGTLPYTVVETQQKLTNAFRKGNADSIVYYATDLGHYIGDAHVPLHTSLNYDGQLTGQRGIHDLWETSAPEAELTNFTIKSRHKATYVPNPQEAIWNIIQHTHSLLPAMFEAERKVSAIITDSAKKYKWEFRWGQDRRFYSKEFAIEYNKVLAGQINNQLIASANAISDFWYTAWIDAGKPDLNQLLKTHYNKKAFKKERNAYRKNKLVEKGWLMSLLNRAND